MATPIQRVSGDITCDTNWCDCVDLDGEVRVRNNATLTVLPGTEVIARRIPTQISFPRNLLSVLIIAKGSKLRSLGTCTDPVVFTTEVQPGTYLDGQVADATDTVFFRKRGMWGGILINGCAPITVGPGPFGTTNNQFLAVPQGILTAIPGAVTAANSPWFVGGGGLDGNGNVFMKEDDDSGILRYTRVEFAGVVADLTVVPDPISAAVLFTIADINGITLNACGNRTVLDHVQVSFSGDDSLQILGGSPNVRTFFSTAPADDGIETDLGNLSCINTVVHWQIPDQDGPDWDNLIIDLTGELPDPPLNGAITSYRERWPTSNFQSNGVELANASLVTVAFDGTGAITGIPLEGAFPPTPTLNGNPNPLLNRPTETYITNATLIGLSCRVRTITNPQLGQPATVRMVGAGICFEHRSCSQVTNAIVAGWTVGLHLLEAQRAIDIVPPPVFSPVMIQLAQNPIKVQQEIFNTLLAANDYNIGYVQVADATVVPFLESDVPQTLICDWFSSAPMNATRYKKNEKPAGNCGIDQRKLTLRCPWNYDCPDIRCIQDKPCCRGAVIDSHDLLGEEWVCCDPRRKMYCREDSTIPPVPLPPQVQAQWPS